MKLLQAMILMVVVLDATLMLATTASSTASPEQVTVNESNLGPNAALMTAR